jgi:CheY-like chemotaxis protein
MGFQYEYGLRRFPEIRGMPDRSSVLPDRHALATRVLRAYGGQEGIDIARRELPDLIILDLMMPGVTGFDVVEALSAFPTTTGIPIIVLTAQDLSPADRSRLNGYVSTIMGKTTFDTDRFTLEVRRATSIRPSSV